MPEEIIHEDGRIEHPEVRNEKTDANFRTILFIILGSMVVAAATYVGVLFFFSNRRGVEEKAKQSPFPLAPAPSTDPNAPPPLPPGEPRLEQIDRMAGNERPNVYERQESREERLAHYGPTDEADFVHVPIDQAMQYLLDKKQLPSRAGPPADRPWRGRPGRWRRVQLRPRIQGETAMTRATMTVFAFALVGCATAVSAVFGSSNTADTAVAQGQPPVPAPLRGVGFDQRVNEQIPLDLPFRDEAGREVRLGDYFHGKPVILVLAYYKCPMLCTEVLNGLARAMLDMSLNAGTDYQVVTVSFDPREGPELAAAKKQTYLERYGRPGGEAGWHFLTGDAEPIERLTKAVGFRYYYDEQHEQFAHASGVMVLTPAGKLYRYFLDIKYSPRDLQLSLVEASNNRVGTVVDQVLLYCFHYDPSVGKYGVTIMNLVRLGGILTVLAIGAFVLVLCRWKRRSE